MKISLRRAHALQHEIKQYIAGISRNTVISFDDSEQDIAEMMETAKSEDLSKVMELTYLYTILATIRQLVAEANFKVGITSKLNTLEMHSNILAVEASIAKITNERVDPAVLKRKLQKGEVGSIASYRNVVGTCIYDKDTIQAFKNQQAVTKRNIQKLKDEVLELNIKTEINLPVEVVDYLKSHNLL